MSEQQYSMPHHHPCWLQIAAHDVSRAVTFYKSALNFNFTMIPDDTSADGAVAMFNFPGGALEHRLGGGIIKTPAHLEAHIKKEQKSPTNSVHMMGCIYFASDDMEATLENIKAAGGRVTLDRMKIPGGKDMGYCAEFEDTEGNFHGIYTQNPPK